MPLGRLAEAAWRRPGARRVRGPARGRTRPCGRATRWRTAATVASSRSRRSSAADLGADRAREGDDVEVDGRTGPPEVVGSARVMACSLSVSGIGAHRWPWTGDAVGALGHLVDAELGEQARAQGEERGVGRAGGGGRRRRGTSSEMAPSVSTSTRSASSTASSTSWVTSSTAGRCRAQSSWTRTCIRTRVSASSAPKGSSSSSSSGSRTSARAEGGPLGLAARERLRPVVLVAGETRPRTTARRPRASASAPPSPSTTLSSDAGPRQQAGVLEHDRAALGDEDVALGAPVEPGEDAQQRGLPRAAAPEEGDELAGGDVEVEAPQHRSGRRRRASRPRWRRRAPRRVALSREVSVTEVSVPAATAATSVRGPARRRRTAGRGSRRSRGTRRSRRSGRTSAPAP